MKFFPANFTRHSRTEDGVPQTSLAAYDPATNQAYLNIHPVAGPEAGWKAAHKATAAFAAQEFTPVGSENWRPVNVIFTGTGPQ